MTTTDHNFVESAIYADIKLGLYGQPVIFSAACLARLRQRAERHLCFNIYVTQASVLRGVLAFLYGINSTQKHDDRARWTTLLVWVEASLPYTANLWCRSSRWPARNTYTEHTLKCTFSISLDIIDWSRIFRAMTRLSSMNIHARMLVFPHTNSCLPVLLRTSYGRDAVSALTLHFTKTL